MRFPKTPLGRDLPALRQVGGVDVLAEPDPDAAVDVLVVAVGATACDVLEAAEAVRQAGYTVRVVDPRWVTAGSTPRCVSLLHGRSLVVTVEDGVVDRRRRFSGWRKTLHAAGVDVATREIGVPVAIPRAWQGHGRPRRSRADGSGHRAAHR